MDYTRKTIELLFKRYPDYLEEILRDQLGVQVNVSKETPESIALIIQNQNQGSFFSHKSSIYKCKCGSNNVVTREIQNRSADEGSTILHICQSCGHIY
jgi:DNA-directed RNA polymerase subunit M/transcription elongation factor TFIIS